LGVSSVLGNSNLTDDRNYFVVLIKTLRALKKPVCEKVADKLEKQVQNFSFYDLHIRNAMLNGSDAKKMSEALKWFHQSYKLRLMSFSISYNPSIGQIGAVSILTSLPKDIEVLGMVACNLSDDTGQHLIEYMQKAKNLSMVCVEENNFSKNMKDKILNLRQQKTGCTIIV
jgi:hypothetical protein